MKVEPINVLSQDELEQIYNASLEVLERAGVFVELEPALKLLDEAGAIVDYDKKNAKIPRSLTEECINSVPRTFELKSRNLEKVVGEKETLWGLLCGPTIIDPYTGKARSTNYKDVEDWSRMCDALENVSFVTPPMATDVPFEISDRYEFEAMINNTGKIIQPNLYSAEGCEDVYEMACIAAGGEEEFKKAPNFVGGGCVVSPLQQTAMALGAWLKLLPKGVPSIIVTEPIAGGTTPVTMAGSFVVAFADVLSGVVITQLIKKGAPIMWSIGLGHIMDMRKAIGLTGPPEKFFFLSVNEQMSKFLGIPSWSGTASDSKLLDAQAGYEQALGFLAIQLGQSDFVMGVGQTLAAKGICYKQAVFENELINMVKRIQRGVEVNKETLAVDLICERGPGANFLDARHTLKHYKAEYQPAVISNRDSVENWQKKGSKDLATVANEKAIEILENHRPEPLPDKVREEMHGVVERAKKRLEKEN